MGMYRVPGSLCFSTGGTERMRIDASGNFGINGASGGATLQVNQATASYIDIKSDNALRMRMYGDSSQAILVSEGVPLIFKYETTEAMRIDASGNVGINGAADAATRLQVRGDTNSNYFWAGGPNRELRFSCFAVGVDDNAGHLINASSSSGVLAFGTDGTEHMRIDSVGTTTIKTNGTTQLVLNRADVSIQSGNQIANLLITGDDPSAGQSGAAINFTAGDAWATNSYPTNIVFYNDNAGTLAPRMTLDADGNLLVGRTGASGLGILNVEGGADFTNGDVYICRDTGNLLVGKTSADNTTVGTTIYTGSSSSISVVRDNNLLAIFNRLNGDGDLVSFRKDSLVAGSIGTKISDAASGDGELYVASGNTGLFFDDVNNYIRPANVSGALRDNTIDLGEPDSRFKNLHLSGKVTTGPSTSSAAEDIYNGGSGRTFQIPISINGTHTWVKISAMNHNGIIEQTIYFTNTGGQWGQLQATANTTGTPPTITVNLGTPSTTGSIVVLGQGSNPEFYSGGSIIYEMGPGLTFA